MPITITRLSDDELKAEFRRSGNSEESLAEYNELIAGLNVGDGFVMPVTTITRDDKEVEVVDLGDEMDAVTVRAFKRRIHAAAVNNGLELKFRPKGHSVGSGDDARFVTERLIIRVEATKAKTSKNGTAD